jgi:hypothetical protein
MQGLLIYAVICAYLIRVLLFEKLTLFISCIESKTPVRAMFIGIWNEIRGFHATYNKGFKQTGGCFHSCPPPKQDKFSGRVHMPGFLDIYEIAVFLIPTGSPKRRGGAPGAWRNVGIPN